MDIKMFTYGKARRWAFGGQGALSIHKNEKIARTVIYYDFLSTPRRGSHVKSDKTHTVIKIHPLSPYT